MPGRLKNPRAARVRARATGANRIPPWFLVMGFVFVAAAPLLWTFKHSKRSKSADAIRARNLASDLTNYHRALALNASDDWTAPSGWSPPVRSRPRPNQIVTPLHQIKGTNAILVSTLLCSTLIFLFSSDMCCLLLSGLDDRNVWRDANLAKVRWLSSRAGV